MMKFTLALAILISAASILSAQEVTAEIRSKVAGEAEQRQKIISKFNELLAMKANQGDKAAMTLARESQGNAGKLVIDFDRMKQILLKWDKGMVKEFKKLPTKEEKILVVKEKFQSLLQEKVNAKDSEALKLAEHGKRHGKIDLTVREMKSYIIKWTEK